MMKTPKVIQSLCSVDWLTMTAKRSQSRNKLAPIAHEFLQASNETGNEIGQWEKYGYTGWFCNGMRWGRREQDDILTLSGDTAGHLWKDYFPMSDNVSRIDLAITLKFDHNHSNLIQTQWDSLQEAAKENPLGRTYSRTEGLQEGYTLYIGSRSSSQFGRLYDKQAESKNLEHWLNCLRWEVEYKTPLSWEVAQELARSASVEKEIYARVYYWFTERYVYVPSYDLIPIARLGIPRKLLPDEKRLEWLKRQVNPTVTKLVQRGLREEVLKSLGLD